MTKTPLLIITMDMDRAIAPTDPTLTPGGFVDQRAKSATAHESATAYEAAITPEAPAAAKAATREHTQFEHRLIVQEALLRFLDMSGIFADSSPDYDLHGLYSELFRNIFEDPNFQIENLEVSLAKETKTFTTLSDDIAVRFEAIRASLIAYMCKWGIIKTPGQFYTQGYNSALILYLLGPPEDIRKLAAVQAAQKRPAQPTEPDPAGTQIGLHTQLKTVAVWGMQ